jgi:hypothetical protein
MQNTIFGTEDSNIFSVTTKQKGPTGQLPLTPSDLLDRPSGCRNGMESGAAGAS